MLNRFERLLHLLLGGTPLFRHRIELCGRSAPPDALQIVEIGVHALYRLTYRLDGGVYRRARGLNLLAVHLKLCHDDPFVARYFCVLGWYRSLALDVSER